MSKVLDYDNLSDEDKQWLRARGWGNRIPGEGKNDPTPGVVLDATLSDAERLALVPNTGTATYPHDHGVAVNPVNPEGYTAEDYESWTVPDLKAEVSQRNEDRNEDDQIKPDSNKKADLVAAIIADDEAHADDDADAGSE